MSDEKCPKCDGLWDGFFCGHCNHEATDLEIKLSVQIGRVLELHAEIDYIYFAIGEWSGKCAQSPIAAAIDKATGFDRHINTEVTSLLRQLRKLRQDYAEVTGDPFDSSKIDDAIEALAEAADSEPTQ